MLYIHTYSSMCQTRSGHYHYCFFFPSSSFSHVQIPKRLSQPRSEIAFDAVDRDSTLQPPPKPAMDGGILLMILRHILRQTLVAGWWFGCHQFFYFPRNIGLLIIPIDELIFFRGVAQPPTSVSEMTLQV